MAKVHKTFQIRHFCDIFLEKVHKYSILFSNIILFFKIYNFLFRYMDKKEKSEHWAEVLTKKLDKCSHFKHMLAKPSQTVYKQDILRFLIHFNKDTDEITKEEIKDYLYDYEKISNSKKKKISNKTRDKNKNAIVYFYK